MKWVEVKPIRRGRLSSLCRHFAWGEISSMGSWQMTNELENYLRDRAATGLDPRVGMLYQPKHITSHRSSFGNRSIKV